MITKASNESNSIPNQPTLTGAGIQGDVAYMPSKYSKAFNSYSKNQIKTVVPFIA